jgi:hypothetical protein
VVFDAGAPQKVMEHEMGHGYTLDHSFNDGTANCSGKPQDLRAPAC